MPAPTLPVPFKRGSTFSFLVEITTKIPDDLFDNWEITSQMRRQKNATDAGFIAEIPAVLKKIDGKSYVLLVNNATENWPVCTAELDIMFESPSGQKVSSSTITFAIEGGITK